MLDLEKLDLVYSLILDFMVFLRNRISVKISEKIA